MSEHLPEDPELDAATRQQLNAAADRLMTSLARPTMDDATPIERGTTRPPCSACSGTGTITVGDAYEQETFDCGPCDGTGVTGGLGEVS